LTIRNQAKEIRDSIHAISSFKIDSKINDRYEKYLHDSFRISTRDLAPDIFSKKVLRYSLYVTEKSCDSVLKTKNILLDKVAMFSYLVELSAREFYTDKSKRTKSHFTAAKDTGYYFTPIPISKKLSSYMKKSKKQIKTILDPACGSGILLATSLIMNPNITKIIGIDSDLFASKMAKKLLNYTAKTLGVSPEIDIIHADSLTELPKMLERNEYFDFIIMNPPYGKLKFLSSSLSEKQSVCTQDYGNKLKLKNKMKKKIHVKKNVLLNSIPEISSIRGTMEYSRLFILISSKLLNKGGILSVISPSTWLGDYQSRDLREIIFKSNNLFEIVFINEGTNFFEEVNQHTAIFGLISGEKTKEIDIINNVKSIKDLDQSPIKISFPEIESFFPGEHKIPIITKNELVILKKISKNKKLSDIENIVNLRGECDITVHKNNFSKSRTSTRLIRGDHISTFKLFDAKDSNKVGYINREKFQKGLGSSSKTKYIDSWRIACPQCSYMKKKKRIEFTLIPRGSVLGNSTNFITLENFPKSKMLDELYFLMAILNNSVVEWYFRIFNKNNHIANYELDVIPIPTIDPKRKQQIKKMIKNLIEMNNTDKSKFELICKIDAEIARCYKLSVDEYKTILNYLDEKQYNLCLNYFIGHKKPSLSPLDLKIINSIPVGGNWQNVPETIPSKRLDQIRKMSADRGIVRTSYYGRLRLEQPAYTISTYFNRPGNGTNIHPLENRTLSLREAATLQSFPYDFTFFGNDGEIRNQIGNAVPPLLGFAIGKILPKETCVDLFCGAGGLSYGLMMEGHKIISGQDIDESSAQTFRYNHPNSEVILGDITKEDIQKSIIKNVKKKLAGKRLGILMGGPPCQGFSTAGWRLKKDKRNSLVKYFFKIAHQMKPRFIILENVPGILNMQNGKILESIQKTLKYVDIVYAGCSSRNLP